MRYLLIGNGPAALAYDAGRQIDDFEGIVVRFNHYSLDRRYAPCIGTRTDLWVTVGAYPEQARQQHRWGRVWANRGINDLRQRMAKDSIGAVQLPPSAWTLGWKCSTGVAFANHLLESGEDVYIYGFDFLEPTRQHHFGDTQERGTVHRTDLEWLWFRQCIHKGIIHQFGWNPAREGIPAVRRPVPCGNDQAPLAGREPCQLGWYKRVAALLAPGTRILDVGAGSGRGVQVLREHGMQAEGLEPDERAPDFPGRVRTPLEEIPDKAYAAVCAVDVMEHVFYDLDFLRHLMRISSGEVFVTMPNFTRSRAANTHHAREYTIAQAWNALEPGWVYVASPDGEAHFTLLLRRTPSGRAMDFSPQGPGNAVGNPPLLVEDDVIPPGRRFNNTVDGQEWPHFLCVWGG